MKHLSRRDMLKLMGLATAGTALAACSQATEAPKAEEPKAEAPKATDAPKAEDPTKAPEPTAVPPKAAPVKITMVESWFGIPQFKEVVDPVMQAISEKMQADGVNVQIESMILEDHQNKYTLLYASGADFTMGFDAPWYKMTTLRTQGALLPLDDLIAQYGPKLKEEITDKIYAANLVDGKLWGVPAAYYYGGTAGCIYRKDLAEQYGVTEPTSEGGWRSLEPFLEAIKTNLPDMIPFGNINAYSIYDITRAHPGWGGNAPTKTGVGIPDVTKDFQFIDSEDDPFAIENAKLLREWWEKGYVNKTDLSGSGPSQNVQVDYVFPGKAASCVENEPDYKYIEQTKNLQSTFPDGKMGGVDMTGMRAGTGKRLGSLKQWNFVVFNATAPTEQHAAGIQFFNWLATSQDNIDLWDMGIDGVNYKKEDNMRFSEIEGVDQARNYRRMWYVSGMGGRFQRQPKDLPVEAEEALKFFSTEENWLFNPYEAFEPDVKALEVDTAKLNGVFDEAVHGLVSGQEPTEEALAKAKKMLDEAGRQEFKAKIQKQLDDFIAAHK